MKTLKLALLNHSMFIAMWIALLFEVYSYALLFAVAAFYFRINDVAEELRKRSDLLDAVANGISGGANITINQTYTKEQS